VPGARFEVIEDVALATISKNLDELFHLAVHHPEGESLQENAANVRLDKNRESSGLVAHLGDG
jgi:hypothetical protein